ncbi:MAG: DUF4185 domain-containing protein [Chloroflexi bacterium]|nr:DUF4185 domain-containing protein [Chloroflexota bacterium]
MYGIVGTDLGSSFEHHGKLFFLFGDTWGRPGDRDLVGWTRSRSPEKIDLSFYKDADGKWLPLTVPGVAQAGFEVPTGGVSVNGKMYIVVTTDWSAEKLMGRSVLAVSTDDGKTFTAVYSLSTTKFINVAFWKAGGWVYLWGSGRYRQSSVCVARVKPGDLADHSRLRYFAGFDPAGRARWSEHEQDAAELFHHNVVGELSVAYIKPVKRYVMLYNSGEPRGIVMRSAGTPWGPWSDPHVIFNPRADGGYGHFMHVPPAGQDDGLSDPGRQDVWGGEYGPYVISRFTTGDKDGCRLFYTMSTWNPYNVVIMQTDLRVGER